MGKSLEYRAGYEYGFAVGLGSPGFSTEENPFEPDTKKGQDWAEGWLDGYLASKGENSYPFYVDRAELVNS